MSDKPGSTPPGPKPLVSPPPAAQAEAVNGKDASGLAPPKGERLEEGAMADRLAEPKENGHGQRVQEGVVYVTPDGEERLVWVVRKGRVQYFSRRDGGRWLGDPDMSEPVDHFAREVGLHG